MNPDVLIVFKCFTSVLIQKRSFLQSATLWCRPSVSRLSLVRSWLEFIF